MWWKKMIFAGGIVLSLVVAWFSMPPVAYGAELKSPVLSAVASDDVQSKNANYWSQLKICSYGDCSQYGFMAYFDILTNSCKCWSGYIFDYDFLGRLQCVLGDTVCHNKYGYNSRYDSLSNSCECSYGYVMSGGQCTSRDKICTDTLGYNSRYNVLTDNCECDYGYVIDGGRCQYAQTVCHTKHGIYSRYNSLTKKCECESGYTMDDSSQCVKKQNNVYFTLKELDTDSKRAIIKSDYDYRYYLVEYNSGCYSSSFKRYLNHQIVVNLGTDFNVDFWDRIVLQNDNETCEIIHVDHANSATTLQKEDTSGGGVILPIQQSISGPYRYLWKAQNGTISTDGTAHEITAARGDIIAMSVTLINRSGRVIKGLPSLPVVAGKVNYGGWGLGTSKPIDNKPKWLDPSSFVINGNRFVYYNGADVPDGGEFTLAWNIKISPTAILGTYKLYLNCVKEWENWTQQVSKEGILLKSPDIFWRVKVI